jgi:uncharacterized protein
MTAFYLVAGVAFGFVLSRSGAADSDFIRGMFLFERFQLYGIIGSAVLLTAPGLWLIKRRGRTVLGRPVRVETKPLHGGIVAGGVLFGVGWAMAGMCPGPIFVNIGEGKVHALAVLAGALVGTGAFGSVYARLQHVLALPPAAEKSDRAPEVS